jgi:predicted transcriptional regulator of viral defense system
MKTPLIWHKLILEKKKIVVSRDIHELAKKLEKNERSSLDYLQRHGYIIRVLRGYYYVRTPEEREMNKLDRSIYELIAMALKEKGVKDWYYGLETALKMNNMTHEYFSIDYVITDTFETTKVISIMDKKFKFLKWNKKHFQFGIEKKDLIRYSDKEKTVFDIAYRTYRNKNKGPYALDVVREYFSLLDESKLGDYMKNYPIRFQRFGEII